MRSFYENNINTTLEELSVLDKKINTNSLLRLALIIGGGAILFQLFQLNIVILVLGVIIAIIIAFSYLVMRQSKLEKDRLYKQSFLQINQNEIDIIGGKKNMYTDGTEFEDGKHPYSSDLDIFGNKSLFELVNRSSTHEGISILANWFIEPADKVNILKRQEASAELSKKRNWVQELQTKLVFNLGKKTNIKTFLTHYLQDNSLKFGSVFMQFYVKICPFFILAAVMFSTFVMPIWTWILLLLIGHLIWTMALSGRVSYFSSRIDKIGTTLVAYADAVKMIEQEEFIATKNKELQNELKSENNELISSAFHRLGNLIDKLDARNNILVGSVLNMFLLWDFKQVLAIVDWKKSYEGNVIKVFGVVAEFEALSSLSILRSNHSDWTDPIILEDSTGYNLVAEDVNHPLIPVEHTVGNSYTTEDHSLALITGSNMAGKSTFLRTIGVNAVLAYSGAVVCAKQFQTAIYKLVTYMRIKDNLNESTSTFKAELDRMKFILHHVEEYADSLFLIDEMLRGTNSVDKYLGSKAIIEQLIGLKGKGMIATHDLQLSTLAEEYPAILKNFHFDIQVIDGEMLFDYKLKDGKCTIFNASMLLKGIGIDVSAS